MHECPNCSQVCYCDLDDSNDCRDDGECFHGCVEDSEEDWTWEPCTCPDCTGRGGGNEGKETT